MSRLRFFGEAPIHKHVDLGYENDIADLIAYLRNKNDNIELFSSSVSEKIIAEKIILASSGIFSSLDSQEVAVLWLSINNSDTSLSLLKRVFYMLSELWWDESTDNSTQDEFNLLTFDIENTTSPDNFYVDHIRPMLSKLYGINILLVLDESDLREGVVQKLNFDNIVQKMMRLAGANKILATIISHSKREISITPSKEKIYIKSLVDNSDAISRIARSLMTLNGVALNKVVDYLKMHIPEGDRKIDELIEDNLLRWLKNGAIKSTAEFKSIIEKSGICGLVSKESVYMDIVPNAGRIISYYSPENLLKPETSLNDIIEHTHKYNDIVGAVGGWLGFINKNDHSSAKMNYDFLKSEEGINNLICESNVVYIKYLLTYLSQMCISNKYSSLWNDIFPLLHQMTMNYADYVQIKTYNYDHIYNISRWITNIGYVYDHSAPKSKRFNLNSRDRKKLFGKAASVLYNATPRNVSETFDKYYALGWQLFDSGAPGLAREEFLNGAIAISRSTADNPEKNDFIDRLTCFAAATSSNRIESNLSTDKVAFFKKSIAGVHFKFGWTTTCEELTSLLSGVSGNYSRFNRIPPWPNAAPDIICCRWDILPAVFIRASLFKRYQIVCAIKIVSSKEDLELWLEKKVTSDCILVGDPATPDGVGSFLAEKDSSLTRLYQSQNRQHFSNYSFINYEKFKVVVIGGYGGKGIYGSWRRFSNYSPAHFKPKSEVMMDIDSSNLMMTLLSSSSKRVGEKIVDAVTGLMKRIPNTSPESQEQLEELKKELHSIKNQVQNKDTCIDINFSKYSMNVVDSFLEAISKENIIKIYNSLVDDLDCEAADPKMLQEYADLMYRVSGDMLKKNEYSTYTTIALDEFHASFRDFRTEADSLHRSFRRTRKLNNEELSDLIVRFKGASNSFIREHFSNMS